MYLKTLLFKLVILKIYVFFVVWSHKFLHMVCSLGCDFFVVYADLQLACSIPSLRSMCFYLCQWMSYSYQCDL